MEEKTELLNGIEREDTRVGVARHQTFKELANHIRRLRSQNDPDEYKYKPSQMIEALGQIQVLDTIDF